MMENVKCQNQATRLVWSKSSAPCPALIFFRNQSKSDLFPAYIIQTAAAKSHLHSAILQLGLALSARDNLESLFSYVEEEEERNRGKSVSFGFTPPFFFSPFLSFTSFDLSIALCRGDEGVR